MELIQGGGGNGDLFERLKIKELAAQMETQELAAQLATLHALWAAINQERQILVESHGHVIKIEMTVQFD